MESVTVPASEGNQAVTLDNIDDATLIAETQKRGHFTYTKDFQFDYDRDESDPLLGNVKRAVLTRRGREIYDEIDNAVRAIPGFQKGSNEKTTDFVKRALNSLAERGGQPQTPPDVEALKTDYESKLTAANNLAREIAMASVVNSLPLNVPDDQKDGIREYLAGKAKDIPHRIDGHKVIFQKLGQDGQTMVDILDPQSHKPISADKFLADQFKGFIGGQQTTPAGTGTKPAPANTATAIPATKAELQEYLVKVQKMEIGSKAFNEAYKKGIADYALTK